MWKLNPFTPREPTSLEGRYVDVGNLKIYVRNAIAEGGFSCVYLARDAVNTSKPYALKHIICNDGESLELVVKEVSVMKMLKGHPNVVSLVAHTILDIGRTKEALILMEFCDKTLVTLLEEKGGAYLEEKQILSIFRDVCNAVFAMHCQSPAVAHRDLKAENVLLGSDGAWKLCDFGSTSTKHKCFDRPEEMGIEEDNIRKHTTPAYRAPEMWDLYRKEVISEKVDIWALGCLLYRICYLKSSFDGESKLQVLNGNYRIPEVPKYSSSMVQLIKDMLEASPDARPDITQVWFRVNEQLPVDLQKHLPDGPTRGIRLQPHSTKSNEGVSKKTSLSPQRNPTRSSREQLQNVSHQSQGTRKADTTGSSMGTFWSSKHAEGKDASSVSNIESAQKNALRVLHHNSNQEQKTMDKIAPQTESNTFVADFDTNRLNVEHTNSSSSEKEQDTEFNNLKEQLKQANLEKAEITSKYEKLSAICHSQRQEIQGLKRALAAATSSAELNKDSSNSSVSPSILQAVNLEIQKLTQAQTAATSSPQFNKDRSKSSVSSGGLLAASTQKNFDAGILELEQAMFAGLSASPSPPPQPWQEFPVEQKPPPVSQSSKLGFVFPSNGPINYRAFGQNSGLLYPIPASPSQSTIPNQGSAPQSSGSFAATEVGNRQPPGWAGF